MTALLSVRGLAAGYDGVAVARDVDLHVAAGEVVALLGPNGAGKSTTLLTIAGALAPIGGEVHFDSARIDGRPAYAVARRGLCLVPEGRSVFAALTTEENLRLGARGGSVTLAHVYDLFPALAALAPRRAGLLSGGEQQMLAVGRALLTDPKLLVVDELSLGLAPIIVERMLPVLRAATAEAGRALLIVEQHVSMALDIADRVYVLAHGELVLVEDAAELRRHPERLTQSYFGTADT